MAKSNAIVTTSTAPNGDVTFNVIGAGSITLVRSAISAEVQAYAATHGLIQRVSDAAAIPRNTETGESATPQEKFDAISALVEHYNSGTTEWARTRGTGEPRESGLVLAAIMRVKSCDEARARAGVEKIAAAQFGGDTKKALSHLASSQAVASAMLDIKRERLAAKFAGAPSVDPLAGF